MTLSGILSSPSQRRTFILISGITLLVSIISIFAITYYAPNTPAWSAANNLFISIVASGAFGLMSGLFIFYFFVDPTDLAAESALLAEDIGQALRSMATEATEYKIYVRTGRHFRSDILPTLIQQSREKRLPIRMEVILLDFCDQNICAKYAQYRQSSSFDHYLWNTHYVQKEVLATILALKRAKEDNPTFLDIKLYLSGRLSTFRIEGSADVVIVTREDPKDTAARYLRKHRNFAAFSTEFAWVRDEARHATFSEILGAIEISGLIVDAEQALKSRSPYAR